MITSTKLSKKYPVKVIKIQVENRYGYLEKLENQFKKVNITVELLTGNEIAILLANISVWIENQENN